MKSTGSQASSTAVPRKSAKKPQMRLRVTTPASSAARRTNVLLEEMTAQMRVAVELWTATRDGVREEVAQVRRDLSGQLDILRIATMHNSNDIQRLIRTTDELRISVQKLGDAVQQNSADIKQNSADIQQNTADIRALGDKLDTKADNRRVDALHKRVDDLEASP
jgi:hypothetical protein